MSKKVYNRIKAVLAEKQVHNYELAEAIGKSQESVSRWCSNTMQPSVETLFEIAEYLDVEVAELLVARKKK